MESSKIEPDSTDETDNPSSAEPLFFVTEPEKRDGFAGRKILLAAVGIAYAVACGVVVGPWFAALLVGIPVVIVGLVMLAVRSGSRTGHRAKAVATFLVGVALVGAGIGLDVVTKANARSDKQLATPIVTMSPSLQPTPSFDETTPTPTPTPTPSATPSASVTTPGADPTDQIGGADTQPSAGTLPEDGTGRNTAPRRTESANPRVIIPQPPRTTAPAPRRTAPAKPRVPARPPTTTAPKDTARTQPPGEGESGGTATNDVVPDESDPATPVP